MSNEEIGARVRKVYSQFVSDVDPDMLGDWLKQEGIVGIEEFQEISPRSLTTRMRCRTLLDRLFTMTNPRTFQVVRKALEHESHYLLEYLNIDTEIKPPTNPDEAVKLYEARLQENENTNRELVKRNEQLEQQLRQMHQRTRSDECRIKQLEEQLKTLQLSHSHEVNGLKKKLTSTERCLHSVKVLNYGLEQERQNWSTEKNNLLKQVLMTTSNDEGDSNCYDFKEITLIHTIKTKASEIDHKGVTGVTILNQELFVVSQMSSEIEVYHLTTFETTRRIYLRSLIKPEDIVACKFSQSLYIFDWKCFDNPKEIIKIDGEGTILQKWPTGKDGGSLSVTGNGTILLIVKEANSIFEFSSNGNIIHELHFAEDSGIYNPLHAIKLHNGNLMVAHGDTYDLVHGVCITEANGNILRSYGLVGKQSISEELNVLSHLTSDEKGTIFALDSNNRQVLLFSNRLDFCGYLIIPGEDLRDPRRLIVDSTNNLIFRPIADNFTGWINGRVLVFKIT